MSGAQTSTFTNVLYDPLMASRQTSAENQLLIQQQDIGGHELEMGARLAGTLLSAYDTPEARAAAYPTLLAQARSVAPGYFKNAPAVYPGDEPTKALARLGTPSKDLLGLSQAGAAASDFGTRWSTQPTATGGGTGATAPASTAPATSGTIEPDALVRAQAVRDGLIKRGLDVDTATAFAANSLHESGANPNVGTGDAGASHGLFQWRDDRYNRFGSVFGKPLDNAPLDQQLDYVVHELGTTEGAARDRIAAAQGPAAKAAAVSQFYLRPKDVQAEMARRSATATQLATQWGGAGTSTAAPVVIGDSLASAGGLGGSGVVGDSPAKVLARVQAESRAGKYSGQPVVLSTGVSNDPTDLASVEQQIREAQGGNAGKITLLGVGPGVEAKAPGTNAKLQALAKSYGAQFVPLPADQMSPDGVHPTAQGYATLKGAIGGPQAGRGGVAGRTGGTDTAGPGAGPGGAPGQPAALPRDQAVAQAQRTGQAVPVAGVDGLWALPSGNLTSTPPVQPTAPPAAPQAQQPPAPSQPSAPAPTAAQPAQPTIPPPPRTIANDLTAEQLAEIPVLKRQVQLGQITAAEADKVLLGYQTANRAAQRQYVLDVQAQQEKAQADTRAAEQLRLSQITSQREQDAAAALAEQRRVENERAAAKAKQEAEQLAKPQQSKSDEADAERVLMAIGPKVRAGTELTPAEADQYDIARRRYARGPLQQVPDGKGGTITAFVGQEVPDRFPPLPGQKEYAGLKPVPGTEKQPDFAPANAMTTMLDIAAGQRKVVKALTSLEAYPGAVGAMALQPNFLSQRTDPEGVRLRADVGDVQGHVFHELSGAAVTASEAPRLKSFTPEAVDTAEALKTKLQRMLEINRETLLDHYRAFGPEAGGRRLPGVEEEILASIPEASINGLKEDPKRAKDFDKKYGRGASKLVLGNG